MWVLPVLVSLPLSLLSSLSACVLVCVCFCGLQCDVEMTLRQGGYTTRFTGLKFINTPRRVRWTSPFKEIVLVCSGALFPYLRPRLLPSSPLACAPMPMSCHTLTDTHTHSQAHIPPHSKRLCWCVVVLIAPPPTPQ